VNAAAAGISVAATGWPRALAALLLVLGVALLLAWALRRSGLAKPLASPRLALVASRPLDGRNRLVVVRWDGREHLLAVGPGGIAAIESRVVVEPQAPPGLAP
jgi:flagellar protein FliO/FliZ